MPVSNTSKVLVLAAIFGVAVVFLAPMIDLPSGTVKGRLAIHILVLALLAGTLLWSLQFRSDFAVAFGHDSAALERGSLQAFHCTRRC
jgi:hypothetical protein